MDENLQNIEAMYIYQEELNQEMTKIQYRHLNKIDIKSNISTDQYNPKEQEENKAINPPVK